MTHDFVDTDNRDKDEIIRVQEMRIEALSSRIGELERANLLLRDRMDYDRIARNGGLNKIGKA